MTEHAVYSSPLFKDLETQLRKTVEDYQQKLHGYSALKDRYESLKQEKLSLVHSETHLKGEVSKLRKDLDDASRKLAETMKSLNEENERLR